MESLKYLGFCLVLGAAVLATTVDEEDDCELHAPHTMHEFCCEIHDENMEFIDCQLDWVDRIHNTNDDTDMELNFCISECVYNKTNYVSDDGKSLHKKLIKNHLEELHQDNAAQTLMYKTFEICEEHAKAMLNHARIKQLEARLAKHKCHPFAGLVFECVSNELILNCPAKQFHSSAQCDHAKSYLEKCHNLKKFT